ncbi:MAG TPA: CopD family protein [Acidobacteriaceae bacterium]|nr:CopD family protein [Acidobacteriaceae bacterium]
MIWLLNDFDLLSMLLHAATLSLEALLVGGVLFLTAVALPGGADEPARRACRRGLEWAALAMILAEIASVVVETSVVVANSGMTTASALSGGPMTAEAGAAFCALVLLLLARFSQQKMHSWVQAAMLAAAFVLMAAVVSLSHAVSRMDHRVVLTAFTALHHLGSAAWIGAMPFLLVALKRTEDLAVARRIVGRFSRMAMVSAALLLGAGIGLAWFYVASPSGLYGTTYGVLVMVKSYLLLLILMLGAANWYVAREAERAPARLLMRLRRFAEVEVALGLTAILAAAALTSQPPAVDMPTDRLTLHEIDARMRWAAPRLKSPPYGALVPPTPIDVAVKTAQYQPPAASDANDMAWSEYNHHWAGLVVLLAGALALVSRFQRMRWARFWPVSFAGLAVFILLRADPENWPLGPRPFWGSFFEPDVLQHRAAAALILVFAAFECAVQAGRLRSAWARYAFPLMCAAGAAMLLTHNHSLGDGKEEVLVLMNHAALALSGVTAGWARWLELRLPKEEGERRVAGYVWPMALMLVGMVLLDYREM